MNHTKEEELEWRHVHYEEHPLGSCIRFYAPPDLKQAERLEPAEAYSAARAAVPMFGLDGMPCGNTPEGKRAIVLLVRKGKNPEDGPFRHEPWFTGGKWDMVTPFEKFVAERTIAELFDGTSPGKLSIEGPIGNQLFGTGWGEGDGPFEKHGVTIQFCFFVQLPVPITKDAFTLDRNHKDILILEEGHSLPRLHPYIRDVIEMSGWFTVA